MPTATLPFGWTQLLSGAPRSGAPHRAAATGSREPSPSFAWPERSLLYGGVALGVLAGAALSTYLWRRRVRALNLLHATPLERAERIISSCEDQLDSIERAMDDLKAAHSDSA